MQNNDLRTCKSIGRHFNIKLHEHGHERGLGKRDEIIIIIIIKKTEQKQ
jgi:hypothetical protein